MVLLPFGERVLFDLPAVSSSPGHTPTHEARSFCDSKALASAPTSAIIWVADSTPKPGTSATDRKSTRLNSSHANISYAVFCLKKKKKKYYNDLGQYHELSLTLQYI